MIYEFTPEGAKSLLVRGLDDPFGLAFDSAGDLFEADNSGNIYEFQNNNGTLSSSPTVFASGLTPTGLVFNSAGDLFVANQNSGSVSEITAGGVKSTFASGSGMNNVQGLAFNDAGDLFVANAGNSDIVEITPDGTLSTFANNLWAPEGLAFQNQSLPVPEPSVMALLSFGTAALLVSHRRNLAA